MYVARTSTRVPLTKYSAAQLSKAVASFTQCNGIYNHPKGQFLTSHRSFSSTSQNRLRDFFPEPEHHQIVKTPPAWPHPGFVEAEMRKNVFTAHREPKDFSDRIALGMVKLLKWGTDVATRYKHNVDVPAAISSNNPDGITKKYEMSESKWLIRFVFLESVAAVPGMVAGMLRHLHSLRRLQRDNGWIETLLEEAYNERMHLLTFLKMAEPGWFMRFLCIGAQGVFFNSMFVAYLISPRTTHRFVGYLEEVAVNTYTLAIEDIEKGLLPKWADEKFVIPDLAVDYWNMPEGHRTMKDLLLYIRADEAKHREVNHTLGSLDQKKDPNPYVSNYKVGNGNADKPRPSKGLEHSATHPVGWERSEVI